MEQHSSELKVLKDIGVNQLMEKELHGLVANERSNKITQTHIQTTGRHFVYCGENIVT